MSAKHVESLFEVFMQLKELGDGTAGLYRFSIGYFLSYLGDKPVSDYSPLDAQLFVSKLKKRLHHGKPIASATVNIYLRCMKSFFGWLVDSEVIAKSPFAKVKPLRSVEAGKDVYEDAEIEAILTACPNDRWRLIVALAATAGLRRGEILNLTVAEVDYIQGVITLKPKADTHQTWFWTIKDHESRKVPITPLTEKLLLSIHASLPDGQPYLCLTEQRYRYLMDLKSQDRLTYLHRSCPQCNFTRTFKAICRRAGIEDKTFHAMRGTALTIMAENGLRPHELQRIAGHSNVDTTYRHYVSARNELLPKARQAAFNGRYRT